MENNNSNNGKITFETKVIPKEYDYIASAGSEIRLLRKVREDDLTHFTLPPQCSSFAVTHECLKRCDIVFKVSGKVWTNRMEETVCKLGTSITISIGTHFQLRNTDEENYIL